MPFKLIHKSLKTMSIEVDIILNLLCVALCYLGRMKDAIIDSSKAIQINPQDTVIY